MRFIGQKRALIALLEFGLVLLCLTSHRGGGLVARGYGYQRAWVARNDGKKEMMWRTDPEEEEGGLAGREVKLLFFDVKQ